jgi:hypothetical protein
LKEKMKRPKLVILFLIISNIFILPSFALDPSLRSQQKQKAPPKPPLKKPATVPQAPPGSSKPLQPARKRTPPVVYKAPPVKTYGNTNRGAVTRKKPLNTVQTGKAPVRPVPKPTVAPSNIPVLKPTTVPSNVPVILPSVMPTPTPVPSNIPESNTAEIEKIMTAVNTYIQGWQEKNADKMLSVCSPDFTGGDTLAYKQFKEQKIKEFSQIQSQTLKINNLLITATGTANAQATFNLAYDGTYTGEYKKSSGEKGYTSSMSGTLLLRKENDKWLIYKETYNGTEINRKI